jgi:hypothetical protein
MSPECKKENGMGLDFSSNSAIITGVNHLESLKRKKTKNSLEVRLSPRQEAFYGG